MSTTTTKTRRRSQSSRQTEQNYTKPELRARLKAKVQRGSKGGRPGEWSARKAQLLVHEYESHGGGYKRAKRSDSQQHLQQWAGEKWRTLNGKTAKQGKTMHRYLPEHVWEQLSPKERKATEWRKARASRKGKQFVPNTKAAQSARRRVTKSSQGGSRKRSTGTRQRTARAKA